MNMLSEVCYKETDIDVKRGKIGLVLSLVYHVHVRQIALMLTHQFYERTFSK